MGLCLKRGRNGQLRPWWYGEYIRKDGSRAVVNLNVAVEGKPPHGGGVAGKGDNVFERSRTRALATLEAMRQEETKARMTKAAALRQYRERTGGELDETPVSALMSALEKRTSVSRSAQWRQVQQFKLKSFVDWLEEQKVRFVLDITVQHVRAYMDTLYNPQRPTRTARTARKARTACALAMDLTLPEDAPNPFRHPTLRIAATREDREIHREPLSAQEVEKLLAAARETDREAHDWMVCALSTGLRRGDVCRLRWEDVDLKSKSLRIVTGKTGAELRLPILPGFAEVLARRRNSGNGDSPFVFPEAEQLAREGPGQLTHRVKKAFVAALAVEEGGGTGQHARVELVNVLDAVLAAVEGVKMGAAKRGRMERVLRLYAAGKTYDEIARETGLSQGCVSGLLTEAEEAAGKRFVRRLEKWGIGFTRVKRKVGMKAASRYDWHCFRTTFVTLAISAGMSADKLRALTSHTTVELVMRHYFKPKGTDFAEELKSAMPSVLTRTRGK